MTSKQWMLITAIVILNVIIFGTLLGDISGQRPSTPTPTIIAYPTFTPMPFPTATAILMPTLSPSEQPMPTATPTATPYQIIHLVRPGETLESIAEAYMISETSLRAANDISETGTVEVDQKIVVPVQAQ